MSSSVVFWHSPPLVSEGTSEKNEEIFKGVNAY